MSGTLTQAAQQFLLRHVPWSTYQTLLATVGDRRVRLTYDRGLLAFMTPSHRHEHAKMLLGRLVEVWTEEHNLPVKSAGSTTFQREDLARGLEPDQCYYIQHESAVRGKAEIDLSVDPPPDLAIEIDITRSVLDRLAIYAALGIPEVWRYDGTVLEVYRLQDDRTYATQDRSPSFPGLPMNDVLRFVQQSTTLDETTLIRSFRQWVSEQINWPLS